MVEDLPDRSFFHKFINLCHKVNLTRSEIEETQRYNKPPYIHRVQKWINYKLGKGDYDAKR